MPTSLYGQNHPLILTNRLISAIYTQLAISLIFNILIKQKKQHQDDNKNIKIQFNIKKTPIFNQNIFINGQKHPNN